LRTRVVQRVEQTRRVGQSVTTPAAGPVVGQLELVVHEPQIVDVDHRSSGRRGPSQHAPRSGSDGRSGGRDRPGPHLSRLGQHRVGAVGGGGRERSGQGVGKGRTLPGAPERGRAPQPTGTHIGGVGSEPVESERSLRSRQQGEAARGYLGRRHVAGDRGRADHHDEGVARIAREPTGDSLQAACQGVHTRRQRQQQQSPAHPGRPWQIEVDPRQIGPTRRS
jgi:hypothetical protein